jgi:Putative auto-transporter adhesin, head GIN domain
LSLTRFWRSYAVAALGALLGSAPAFAADRNFTVTDFDRVEIDGAFTVAVETGKSASVRASGTTAGVEQMLVEVRGRTLRIRPKRANWGGWPGERPPAPKIRVTVPFLRDATLQGSGALSVTKMRAGTVRVFQLGGGQISVAAIEADQLIVGQSGAGLITLSGKALTGKVSSDGSGRIEAAKLTISDMTLTSSSAGTLTLLATRSAKVTSIGAGEIIILGKAACTVSATGSGEVRCGK